MERVHIYFLEMKYYNGEVNKRLENKSIFFCFNWKLVHIAICSQFGSVFIRFNLPFANFIAFPQQLLYSWDARIIVFL